MNVEELLALAGLVGAVLLGSALQRTTGVGFALVAAPFLVALLGPFNGILVVNLFGMLTALLVFFRVFRRVEYKRVFWLLLPALVATVPGAWVAVNVPPAELSVVVGVLIIIALAGSFLIRRRTFASGRGGALAGGLASGFMNVTAGVGGPAITAYAVASRWPQHQFAASVQLYFCVLGAGSMLAKFSLPTLDAPQWAGTTVGLVAGIIAGEVLGRRVSAVLARRVVIGLAFLGAMIVMLQGLVDLAGS